jgi:hypothetical protein
MFHSPPYPFPQTSGRGTIGENRSIVSIQEGIACWIIRVMTIRDIFYTRPPPPPVLSAAQQLDWFLNSIQEKNSSVVTGKLEEFDELYRSKKPL